MNTSKQKDNLYQFIPYKGLQLYKKLILEDRGQVNVEWWLVHLGVNPNVIKFRVLTGGKK